MQYHITLYNQEYFTNQHKNSYDNGWVKKFTF